MLVPGFYHDDVRMVMGSHRLMKQRARLLKLREDLSKEIQQLTAEAREETPNYSIHMADAGTDSFDRDLVLGLVSFEQEGLYEIDAALKCIAAVGWTEEEAKLEGVEYRTTCDTIFLLNPQISQCIRMPH